MFPGSHPNYVFVTKIPRMLILYFPFLKNNNSSLNDTVVIESAVYVFFLFSLNVSYCFWQIVLLTYREQVPAHIFNLYSTKKSNSIDLYFGFKINATVVEKKNRET